MSKAPRGPRKAVRRGPWSREEDAKLTDHIAKHGLGRWSDIPRLAGIERGGKSCRLRWLNYLRPDLKRAALSQEEEDLIIQLHSIIGNSWTLIAACLPGRTDNGVKNFWNASIKHKLRRRGIDPDTHEPMVDEGTRNGDAQHILPSHLAAGSNTCSHGALPLPDSITSYVDTDPLELQHGVVLVQPVVSSSSKVGSDPSSTGSDTGEQCPNGADRAASCSI
ncbi:myb-related protein Hv33 [Aegilops tauschii subsp. strangulata]|uniref:Uncharacterized protein n=3 Tax=Triticinae TaxID=1648030 RepID=A0A453J0Q2_AEGTS|nr:myb-related protein Hv33 [Aegilops tauschii subsp. strangulata]XP_020163438.1 myb-related protein Hv33 [Aegilops tauschii subsp. strangulata]XP_044378276.1 myb-related protein Hv33-like [Triticum aestivum]XP_044378277.1 myb-related protein Hv33-like [Triticum aestivum]